MKALGIILWILLYSVLVAPINILFWTLDIPNLSPINIILLWIVLIHIIFTALKIADKFYKWFKSHIK